MIADELCDSEGCCGIAAVAISVPDVDGECYLCRDCYESARPAMESSKADYERLLAKGCHARIAARIVRISRQVKP